MTWRSAIGLLLLAGCTSFHAVAISGQTLITGGNQFVQAGALYAEHCHEPIWPPEIQGFCDGFKTFAPKFKLAYPLAVTAWNDAMLANDVAQAQGAEAVLTPLVVELSRLTAQALTVIGGQR